MNKEEFVIKPMSHDSVSRCRLLIEQWWLSFPFGWYAWASCQDHVRRSGGKAPLILNLGTGWCLRSGSFISGRTKSPLVSNRKD